MKESIELIDTFNVKPEVIYNAWLNSEKHSQMTGGEAVCSHEIGARFSAWDGYIQGQNKVLIPNTKIVQTWRTSEFSDTDEDSLLTIHLKELNGSTELKLVHTHIPEGQTQYKNGWLEHYFEPMHQLFG